jgi:vitamin B12 transporter
MTKMVCAGVTLALMAGLAQAAEPQEGEAAAVRDEMVVTATRSEEKVKETPAKVEVIDSQDIALTSAETVTEQLKKSSAISVIEYPGALAGIGIRGFRPEYSGITKHSLVLINGRPAGATNLATILTDNVERIEVLKGPASSLYGAEAMGGVVNVITKKNQAQLTGEAELGLGSFSTNFQKVALGGGLGEVADFDLNARRYDQADDLTMGNGEDRANTSYRTQNGSLRVGADLGTTWRVDLTGDLYQGRDIETPGDIAYGEDERGLKDIDRHGVDLTVGGEVGADNQLSLTGYRTREETTSYSYSYWGESVPRYNSYDSEIDWTGVQVKDEYTWGRHRFIAGIDYQYIEKEARSYSADGSRESPSTPDEGRTNWAGYLETVWKLLDDRLTATAGGRYDTFEVETLSTPYLGGFTPNAEDFSTFSPRVGLNYLFDSGFRAHATVGQAFVPPSAVQLAVYSEKLVGDTVMITQGNADLDPETSTTWDSGLGLHRPEWGLNLDCTYFSTDVDDRITTIQHGNIKTYVNSLGAEIQGLEGSADWDLGAILGWNRTVALYFNSTNIFKAEEEVSAGTYQDIHNVADYTYNYGIRYEDEVFDGKFHFRTVGPMRDTDWTAMGYPEIEYPEFTVADLVVGVDFLEHHRVALTVDNLFDEDYYEKKGYPKPGRGFFISYRFSF